MEPYSDTFSVSFRRLVSVYSIPTRVCVGSPNAPLYFIAVKGDFTLAGVVHK